LKQAEASDLSGEEAREKVREVCKDVHGADLRRCIEMGRLGAEWLWSKRGGESQGKKQGEGRGKEGLKVITVCNTGSLATSVSGFLSWIE
jgi:methylthioribose-1-phosphate isomerase